VKLYSTICYGFLVIFLCNVEKPTVISDFCQQVAPEIRKLSKLSEAEIAALARPRKEAIVSLRRKYTRLCHA
jgi:hypothetical protein